MPRPSLFPPPLFGRALWPLVSSGSLALLAFPTFPVVSAPLFRPPSPLPSSLSLFLKATPLCEPGRRGRLSAAPPSLSRSFVGGRPEGFLPGPSNPSSPCLPPSPSGATPRGVGIRRPASFFVSLLSFPPPSTSFCFRWRARASTFRRCRRLGGRRDGGGAIRSPFRLASHARPSSLASPALPRSLSPRLPCFDVLARPLASFAPSFPLPSLARPLYTSSLSLVLILPARPLPLRSGSLHAAAARPLVRPRGSTAPASTPRERGKSDRGRAAAACRRSCARRVSILRQRGRVGRGRAREGRCRRWKRAMGHRRRLASASLPFLPLLFPPAFFPPFLPFSRTTREVLRRVPAARGSDR